MATQWYAKIAGEVRGPMQPSELKRLAELGIVTTTTEVSKNTPDHWVPASRVQGLSVNTTPTHQADSQIVKTISDKDLAPKPIKPLVGNIKKPTNSDMSLSPRVAGGIVLSIIAVFAIVCISIIGKNSESPSSQEFRPDEIFGYEKYRLPSTARTEEVQALSRSQAQNDVAADLKRLQDEVADLLNRNSNFRYELNQFDVDYAKRVQAMFEAVGKASREANQAGTNNSGLAGLNELRDAAVIAAVWKKDKEARVSEWRTEMERLRRNADLRTFSPILRKYEQNPEVLGKIVESISSLDSINEPLDNKLLDIAETMLGDVMNKLKKATQVPTPAIFIR